MTPDISIVVLNYNGDRWIEECLKSIRNQTAWNELELNIVDNASTDNSYLQCWTFVKANPEARCWKLGANYGYCQANNFGAEAATGRYILFLNNDTRLHKDCIRRLVEAMDAAKAGIGAPLIFDYGNIDSIQCVGIEGLDIFGHELALEPNLYSGPRLMFAAPGCALCIRRDLFEKLGGFRKALFMYEDEVDICWRAQMLGERVYNIPQALCEHKGKGAEVGTKPCFRALPRYLSNRNSLVVILANAQHIMLVLAFTRLVSMLMEGLAVWIWYRKWSYFKECYIDALKDVCIARHLITEYRAENRRLRIRSDFSMLRYLRPWRIKRLAELFTLIKK